MPCYPCSISQLSLFHVPVFPVPYPRYPHSISQLLLLHIPVIPLFLAQSFPLHIPVIPTLYPRNPPLHTPVIPTPYPSYPHSTSHLSLFHIPVIPTPHPGSLHSSQPGDNMRALPWGRTRRTQLAAPPVLLLPSAHHPGEEETWL